MKNTKENTVFNINNIIISAFGREDEYSKSLMSENNNLSKYADKELKKEYEKVLSGNGYEIPKREEANIVNAVKQMNNNPAQAYWEFVQMLKNNPDNLTIIKSITSALIRMKAYDFVLANFIPKLEKYKDDFESKKLIAETYFRIPDYYPQAITLYEELLDVGENREDIDYRLAYLYERVYQDRKLDVQIDYAKRALEIFPNSNRIYAMLAKMYYRAGEKGETQKYFDKLLSNNPSAEDRVAYSRFLMKEGRLTEGYDIYRCRFETDNVAYPDKLVPEKRWSGKEDISNSTVIVHYEQGFGDSVMFSRYIPSVAARAKKVIFVVQKNLIPIFKSSGYEKYCQILSHEADVNPNITLKDNNRSIMYSSGSGMAKIPHDYHIPLMDTPYLFGESPERMSEAGGYLLSDRQKVEEFREKFINKNKKFKIGISFHGTKDSILTYRDMSVKEFLPLIDMAGVEVYSFQADRYAKEIYDLGLDKKIIDLGKDFRNFEDTACAINCMDLIVSTDNVVMNLAGALGVRTFGLFNVFSESRWYKTEGDDIGWYKSVKPFRAETFNDWENVIKKVKIEVEKIMV